MKAYILGPDFRYPDGTDYNGDPITYGFEPGMIVYSEWPEVDVPDSDGEVMIYASPDMRGQTSVGAVRGYALISALTEYPPFGPAADVDAVVRFLLGAG